MDLKKHLRPLKRLVRQVMPVQIPLPDWETMLGADLEQARQLVKDPGPGAPDVLLAPTVGGTGIVNLESVLALALALRGARPHVWLCDQVLTACQTSLFEKFDDPREFLRHGPSRDLCRSCHLPGEDVWRTLGVRVHRMSEYLEQADRERAAHLARTTSADDAAKLVVDGVNLGEHVRAGAIRYFARGALEREPDRAPVIARYVEAAVLAMLSTRRLFERNRFLSMSAQHGIYVPQGIYNELARRHGVRIVNWALAYRDRTFIFSHGDTYHHTMMAEPTSQWDAMPFGPAQEAELMEYLQSRWEGTRDWVSFNRAPESDVATIQKTLGLDPAKPTIGLLTNVVWDAQLHYPDNAFPDMVAWIAATIEHFARRPELQLVIRVHPAERSGMIKSRQPVTEEIAARFPQLPPNVFIIPPESKISTYSVMLGCDSVLIYGTKTGVELTSFGIPVIVAGEAWIRNKGITTDVSSAAHYEQILSSLPLGQRLPEATIARARRYAYHFFFRRMVPLRVIERGTTGWAPFDPRIARLSDLAPGADAGLDVICDGIIRDTPFVYPAELRLAAVPSASRVDGGAVSLGAATGGP